MTLNGLHQEETDKEKIDLLISKMYRLKEKIDQLSKTNDKTQNLIYRIYDEAKSVKREGGALSPVFLIDLIKKETL